MFKFKCDSVTYVVWFSANNELFYKCKFLLKRRVNKLITLYCLERAGCISNQGLSIDRYI